MGKSYSLRQPTGHSIKGKFHVNQLREFRLREGYLVPSCESQMPLYQTSGASAFCKKRRNTKRRQWLLPQEIEVSCAQVAEF